MVCQQSIPDEITEHISWLEHQIAHALVETKIVSAEIRASEEGLRIFLKEYYSELGGYFTDLVKLDSRIGGKGIREAAGEPVNESEKRDSIKANEAKNIFRKLAKYCHPDASDVPNAKQVFSEVNEAYQKRDLFRLILLEQAIMEDKKFANENAVQKLERLEKKYEMARFQRNAILDKQHKLKFSPAYRLWKQISSEQQKGRDVVREIKLSVMREINARERLLSRRVRPETV